MPGFCDTHCHLDFHAFEADRPEVLERARQAGVERILIPGIDLAGSRAALALVEQDERLFLAAGVHPNSALTWQADSAETLRSLAAHPRVAALGEIGLDYYRDHAPRPVQRQVFVEQLRLAAELGLPVVIHNRQATEDLLAILADWHAGLVAGGSPLAGRPGVLHSYGEALEPARQALAMNFFIGITGPVTFKNAPELQGVVRELPLEALLIETDAPFLTPHPHRGRRNEPAYVAWVAQKIAQLQNRPLEAVARQTTHNAARLFGWGVLD